MPRRVRRFVRLLLLSAIVLALAACSAVAGIFKAGMWTGVLVIVVVIALIVWLFGRRRG
jgi:TRAP-type C4-dicarboxylate transport system permease large subunit